MKDEQDLGLTLRLERVRQRLSQREVARAAGLRPARLSDLELGWAEPRRDELTRIANVLRIKPRDLKLEGRA